MDVRRPPVCFPVPAFSSPLVPRGRVGVALALLICGLLGSCAWGPSRGQRVSALGRERCDREAQREGGVLKRWYVVNRCLATIEQRLAKERAAAARRQATVLAERLAFCRRTRPLTAPLVAELREQNEAVDRLRAERYRPSPRPPAPDAVLQSKLPVYDQELDQERYSLAVQAWQSKEAVRSAAWAARHARQLAAAEGRQLELARRLRRVNPALFVEGGSTVLDAQAVRRYADCRPEGFR